MRIGIMTGDGPTGTLDGIVARAKDLEQRGFHSVWMANIFGLDAIGTLAIVGRETERIELGTAVVPTFPRHPVAIAQQTLTTQAACGGRFSLGIGLSHKIVIEDMFGFSYDKPARNMREYLEVLTPLLRGEPAKFAGEQYRVQARPPGARGGRSTVPLLDRGARAHVMLKIAGTGRMADGTITLDDRPEDHDRGPHRAAASTKAAEQAGRPAPRVVAGLPIAADERRGLPRARA